MTLRIFLRNIALAGIMVVCAVVVTALLVLLYAFANSIYGSITARIVTTVAVVLCIVGGAFVLGE